MSLSKNILMKVFQGIYEYLLFFPVFIIIGINIFHDHRLWSWVACLFVLFIVGVTFRSIFLNQKWWLFSLFSIVVGAGSSFIFTDHLLFVIILAIVHILIVYRGMMYVGQRWEDVLPLSFLWLGSLGMYFVGYFVFRFVESLNPYLNYISTSGILLIVMIMFVSNRDHLKNTTLSKDKTPFISSSIKRQNRIFLLITIFIILLITNGRKIQEWIGDSFRSVIKWLIEFMSRSGEKEVIEEPPTPSSMEPAFPFEEPKEPSIIAEFLEMITMYATYLFLVVAVIFLLLLFIKKTRMWIINGCKKIIQFLKEIVSQVITREESTQYVEEKESVFNWKEWKDEQQSKAKGFVKNILKRKPSWNSLSNQEKVRFVFRKFILQEMDQTKLKEQATPREILEEIKRTGHVDERQIEQLKIAYEKTRYGERDVDEQLINEIHALIKGN